MTVKLQGQLTHKRLFGKMNAAGTAETYTIITSDGEKIQAVVVGEEVVFTATADDIRAGTVAATGDGVTTGTKVIPSYHTEEGYVLIPNGSAFAIPMGELYNFTKLQAIICPWAGSIAGSVAAEKVSLDENVFAVNSTESLSTVARDSENLEINFGITNESGSLYVVRYFTYKEII